MRKQFLHRIGSLILASTVVSSFAQAPQSQQTDLKVFEADGLKFYIPSYGGTDVGIGRRMIGHVDINFLRGQ